MARVSVSTSHNLDQQGFDELSESAKARFVWPLRFTPAVCIAIVAVGLVLRSPVVLGAVALIGVSGVLFPNGMVVDLLYNRVVRHLFGAPRLPPTWIFRALGGATARRGPDRSAAVTGPAESPGSHAA